MDKDQCVCKTYTGLEQEGIADQSIDANFTRVQCFPAQSQDWCIALPVTRNRFILTVFQEEITLSSWSIVE